MIATQTTYHNTTPRTLPEALAHCGWALGDRLQSAYTLETPFGQAVLKKNPTSGQGAWVEWILESPNLPLPHPKNVFAANGQLPGPWKFVVASDGSIVCRGDVPREVFVTDDAFDLATGRIWSPLACWAEAATLTAGGTIPEAKNSKPAPAELVAWLKEHGFVASADGDAVQVTVPLSGTFREVAVQWNDQGEVHLKTEIGRLNDWPTSSLQAADEFLHEANRRLRLVRVMRPEESFAVFMEVRFRAPGPGVWVQSALDGLCISTALVLPLAAVRDARVAEMLLAGSSANRKEEV